MNINFYKEVALDFYFFNYLLINDIDYEEYKDVIFDNLFLQTLELTLEANLETNLYTREMYEKIGNLINYINTNIKSDKLKIELENINNFYTMLKEYPSNEFYNNEFLCKYDLIDENLKNKAFIWNKKDIEESVKDDYYIILYLNMDFEQFKEMYIKKYVGNVNYLLFLNKFINMFPYLVIEKNYFEKILFTLEYNKKLNISEAFSKLNDNIYNKVTNINEKNINKNFNLKIFDRLYFNAMFEKMIILNEKVNIDYTNPIILSYLYMLIDDYNSRKICNSVMVKRIINIMNEFKKNIKNIDINAYNKYLCILNSMELSEYGYVITYLLERNLYKEIPHIMTKPYLIDEYLETINLDFNFLESLLCDQEYDEKYLKHFIYNDDYYLTIEKYLNECPLMFRNKEIYDKVIKTINKIMDEYKIGNLNSRDYYKQYKKLLKKLEKGKY